MSTPEAVAGVEDVDLTGQTALVTGSTSGIGREAALALGRLGAEVLVHGRDPAAGQAVVADLAAAGADATFVRADFAGVETVRELAATVREETDSLDLLFNNAGGYFRSGELTDLGVEYTFHVNHLSPYLLTAELLDHLAAEARVVTTASAAHRGTSLDIERVRSVDSYSATWAYSHSKLANVLFATELARRLRAVGRSVTTASVHPGAIPGSGFTRFLPGPLSSLASALDRLPLVTSVADGAAELLYAGLHPDALSSTGQYYADLSTATPTAAGRDADAARRLWTESASMLGVEEPLATESGA